MTLPTAAVVRTNGIPHLTGTSEDTNIDTLIARADSVLASWCGFPASGATLAPPDVTEPTLESTTYTHYLDGPQEIEPRALLLPVRPVLGITSIHQDTTRDWTYDAGDLVDSGDYTLDSIEGRVYLHHDSSEGDWRTGVRMIRVVYVAGYDTGADARITQGITALVAFWWQQRHSAGLDSVTLTDTTIEPLPSMIPDHVKEIMWPIRLPEVGIG